MNMFRKVPVADVLQVTSYNLTQYGDPGHFVGKHSGWVTVIVCLYLKIYSYSTILFCIMYGAVVYGHTSLKLSSENCNPQIPEITQKNNPIHPQEQKVIFNFDVWLFIYLKYNLIFYANERSLHFQ